MDTGDVTRAQESAGRNGRLATPPSVIAAEQALVARVRAGDPDAFDAIYAHYHDQLRNYVAKQVGEDSTPGPDDLTQDAFLKAWLALQKTARRDGEFRLTPWLFRIATNVCRDQQRHRKLVTFERFAWFATTSNAFGRGDTNRWTATDWGSKPEHEALDAELRAEVTRVLEELGAAYPQYRRVLVLREFQDLSYDACAAVLGTSRAAVKSLLYRARGAFAALWADPERAAPPRANAPSVAWLAAKLQAAHAHIAAGEAG